MKALGGSFEIESAPNQGTTATLTLPLGAASSGTEAEPAPFEASQEGSGEQSAQAVAIRRKNEDRRCVIGR